MDAAAQHLLLHASLMLLVGLLCGMPYGRAILREQPAATVFAWRVAHQSLSLGAGLLIAIAAALNHLPGLNSLKTAISLSFIVSAWGFMVALPLGASTGHRGLSSNDLRGNMAARGVYLGNLCGAITSLIGSALLVIAAFLSLL